MWPPHFPDPVQSIICPLFVEGYSLSKKLWVLLDVNKVTSISSAELKNHTTLNKVILPSEKDWKDDKTMLLQLISCHGVDENEDSGNLEPLNDIVKGKGRGLIILLHGKCLS